ncbi:hypothetical protein UFOVP662_25 [uncultured Caudovirales phage]|uniref:Uncharacterized protein n=1 Tax=uncultured Caudovirales phage TaxID=2100421 RepID=A0A6J5QJW7_9CAUD|nr:hypothetical protein UFOVP662_25 [uncultured Caudovirales phage]CAB4181245.1 hypothetical protein UFOVP1067_25 [uncultured Caudovirales phage]
MTDTITLPRATVVQALETLKTSAVTVDSFGVQQATQDAITALRTALEQKQAEQQAEPVLQEIEQYRMQMAGISTAAIGYWKEGDGIHPDYDTLALRDVAKLYAKYDELYKAQPEQQAEPDRRPLQAEGKHPAPCARHCEAKAFEIEIRSLKSALETQAASKEDMKVYRSIVDNYWKGLAAKAEQQAEPTCPDCKAAVLYECVACSSNNYPPKQQAEPVAYDKTAMNCFVQRLYDSKMKEGKHGHYETMFHVVHEAIKRFAPPKQQAEPVAWTTMPEAEDWCFVSGSKDPTGKLEGKWFPLYTTPPQRQWVGLTVTTILNMMPSAIPAEYDGPLMEFARAVEAKLKEKNT